MIDPARLPKVQIAAAGVPRQVVSGRPLAQAKTVSYVSKSTARRRFLIWSRAGVLGRLHEELLHRLDDAGLLDLSRAVLDSAHVRAKKGGANSQVRAPWTGGGFKGSLQHC